MSKLLRRCLAGEREKVDERLQLIAREMRELSLVFGGNWSVELVDELASPPGKPRVDEATVFDAANSTYQP